MTAAGKLGGMLVDDRADFRGAFATLLDRQPDIEVVAQAGSISEARLKLRGVDVALVDRGLPDGDGLSLVGELRLIGSLPRRCAGLRQVPSW